MGVCGEGSIPASTDSRVHCLSTLSQVMLLGIEAHVCVLQTTLDLLEKGYEVHLLVDGISSQRPHDRAVALHRLSNSGRGMHQLPMRRFTRRMHPNCKRPT